MSDPLLEAEHLGRRHPNGNDWLLDDISLSILPGACLGVGGPSGAGKTLLLRALAFLDPLESGILRWRGTPIRANNVHGFRGQVILVHQRPALIERTVEAALRRPFALRTHRGGRFDRVRIEALLRRLGRDDRFLDKSVGDLSGGERQIVALVRAVQLAPSILLLDEPTAALDADTVLAVEHWLTDWLAQGEARAMVWVSHDAAQARRVTSRRVRIEGGLLVLCQD